MFKTSIGPHGDLVGYLRSETAQVIISLGVYTNNCLLSRKLSLEVTLRGC
jgi:glycyl-tRNA synthetase (class II)